MKHIIVCVKIVPVGNDVTVDSEYHMERNRVSHQLNIADMAAVEAALRWQPDADVTVLTMGPQKAEEILQDLLNRGVNRAILLTDRKMAGADSYATAVVLKAAIQKLETFDLILCGRKTVDGETGQVPGELSAALHIPCITNVSSIECIENKIHCDRLLENGIEILETGLPAIISMCEYSYPLRLPSIRMRRLAAGKQVERWSLDELGLSDTFTGQAGSKTQVLKATHMETGLRKGPRETDVDKGIEALRFILKEKQS